MSWIDWGIVLVPMAVILWMAFYSRRYIRDVVDFLAAGRVAGRYVMSVGSVETSLGVMTLVALVEAKYQCGFALIFWNYLIVPVTLGMALTGYCVYRFRATRALSFGQFLEMRYNRALRIVAAILRCGAEMLANSIGPAVAANFFIYFLGIPHHFTAFGICVPSFAVVVAIVLTLAVLVMWSGGRIALLVTDSLQGLMSYPIFVIVVVFILSEFSWEHQIIPVMESRVAGESFLNPFNIDKLRDFNIFSLVVTIIGLIVNRGSWIGNDTSGSGRTPHEQKMAGILGAWRGGFSEIMCLMVAITVITAMYHVDFAPKARVIRHELVGKVAAETVPDGAVCTAIQAKADAIANDTVGDGELKRFSRGANPDTPYLEAAGNIIENSAPENGSLLRQKFSTLYHQMMMPVVMRNMLPCGLLGIFCLLMVMLMLSTDDSRIFNSSSTIIQDIVMPLRKKPFTPREHLLWLRWGALGVAMLFFLCSIFFVQIDYISMFMTIMTTIWLGGAGPIMIFGLYSRFGNTAGAFASLFFGSGFAVGSVFLQRNWADSVYPFLEQMGWAGAADTFLTTISAPFAPYIVWKINPLKFPINSYEVYFLSMVFGIIAYVAVSLLTRKRDFDLDALLHRGEEESHSGTKRVPLWQKVAGITAEYTRGDRIIAWSVVFYTFVYSVLCCFVLVLAWNWVSPWPDHWWGRYFLITGLLVPGFVGAVSTVWFFIGGMIDMRRLFHDLALRRDDPDDDGRVEHTK